MLGEESFDLVHLRMLCGSVSSWPEMYQKVFAYAPTLLDTYSHTNVRRHLRPGSGWIEHVEIDLEPRCDDHTLSPDSQVVRWYGYLRDATARAYRPIAYERNTRQLLEAAGFIDIQETIIRAPFNSWPNDPHQKEIGRWYNLGLTEGLDALSFAPFTRSNQWDLHEHVKPLLASVHREIMNRKIHAYNNM
jgi:hypothetical protein